METHEQPGRKEQWDGVDGLRYTGIGQLRRGNEYSEADTQAWLGRLGLPPVLPGEQYYDWAKRTAAQRGVGRTVMGEVQEIDNGAQEAQNG